MFLSILMDLSWKPLTLKCSLPIHHHNNLIFRSTTAIFLFTAVTNLGLILSTHPPQRQSLFTPTVTLASHPPLPTVSSFHHHYYHNTLMILISHHLHCLQLYKSPATPPQPTPRTTTHLKTTTTIPFPLPLIPSHSITSQLFTATKTPSYDYNPLILPPQ